MRQLSGQVQALLAADALVPRDFIWIEARRRDTGDAVTWGAWSDLGAVDAQVIDPVTGDVVTRTFEGAGALVEVGAVTQTAGLEVQVVTLTLNDLADGAERLVREYDARRARLELFRGFLDPVSLLLPAPAVPRFVGFVDEAPIVTPESGGTGSITLTCAGHPQELTRKGTATRSDADQRRRAPGDAFYQHAASVGTWDIKWGGS